MASTLTHGRAALLCHQCTLGSLQALVMQALARPQWKLCSQSSCLFEVRMMQMQVRIRFLALFVFFIALVLSGWPESRNFHQYLIQRHAHKVCAA